MTYAPEHEKELPNRSHRRRMEMPRAPRSGPQQAGTTEDPQPTQDPRCGVLRLEERLPLATAAREFPPWETVYSWFRKWTINGTFERLNAALREVVRTRSGRNPLPSTGIADSQSTKTTGVGGEQRGYDGHKKVRGRKRHLLVVDTEGLVLKAKVHSAKIPEQDGLRRLLESSPRAEVSHLKHLWLDAGYEGRGILGGPRKSWV